jgi:hypothetical protein
MFMTRRQISRVIAFGALIGTLGLTTAGSAGASLRFTDAQVGLSTPDGESLRQAGGHPDLIFKLELAQDTHETDGSTVLGPAEQPRNIDLDLPKGLVGNPTAYPTCSASEFGNGNLQFAGCPTNSQVGTVDASLLAATPIGGKVGIYNLEHAPDVAAQFGFKLYGVVVIITARVRPGDYGITSGSINTSQGASLIGATFDLWGVPADPAHDSDRLLPFDNRTTAPVIDPNSPSSFPSTARRRPFLTNPTNCSSTPSTFTVQGDSWEFPGVFDTRTLSSDAGGAPFVFAGCERLTFDPSATVQPLSHTADAPTGAVVDVALPQNEDPDGLATPTVRRVVTLFPLGMSVSPSSAAGLGACSSAQINLGTNDAPDCPASSKIGTVTIDTPLLEDPLDGDVILASQDDNPFRSLIAVYLAVKGPGFYLKLPGKGDLDPVTGQLAITFDNTPQLPFSKLHVALQGGSQAPLATPTKCGTYTTRTSITSWASDEPVELDSPMTIDQGCDAPAFAPSFAAGTTSPLAGKDTAFSFTLTRTDRMPFLSQIDTALPAGVLARIGSVPECADNLAANGACPVESDLGSTSVLSGPGAAPLALKGRVYLTGPYKGAPFGLAIEVPTAGQAGPFNLGTVTVRAGIYVDRTDAHVTVKSDPLPTIIRGIPLRLRQVNVTIDRPKFLFNPTSCGPTRVFGAFQALGGGGSAGSVPFQVGGCGDLDVTQKLALRFTGKSSTKDGTHPGIVATLSDKGGGTNVRTVETKLPLSVALDPDNANDLCEPDERAAFNCPKGSIVGSATAKSVLKDPLTGPVYFVRGLRKSATGRTVRTLPKLWIPLSGDGVTIDLNADSSVDSINRLVTKFHDIPDAPITSVVLKINGGKHGIIVVSGKPGTCDRDRTIDYRITGQNKDVRASSVKSTVEGCKPKVTKTKSSSKSVTIKVDNIGSGRLTLAGAMIRRAARTLGAGSSASITATLTSEARQVLRRHKQVNLKLKVSYQPKSGSTMHVTKTVAVRP